MPLSSAEFTAMIQKEIESNIALVSGGAEVQLEYGQVLGQWIRPKRITA